MPNQFDVDPRSPSMGRLFVLGLCFVVMMVTVGAALISKSQGKFADLVNVTAQMTSVGDGLPAKSDVKFRGVLVGFVESVSPPQFGEPNTVHIALKGGLAQTIPDTVTARVVPSNVFAVSSVQLVDNGHGAPVTAGAVIREDTSLPTILFQTTLNKLRELLLAVGRDPSAEGIGALTALGQATQGRGPRLREAAGDLNTIVTELNKVVSRDTGPSTISALNDAVSGLNSAAPDLVAALDYAIQPARTLAEKRAALTDLLSTGLSSAGQLRDAFNNQTDRLINITTQMSPVIGTLADNSSTLQAIPARVQTLADKAYSVWNPKRNMLTVNIVLTLSPFRTYVRADCPRYGELAGPSCSNAPEVPTTPGLYPNLASMGFAPSPGLTENRPNLAPPRDSAGSFGRIPSGPLPSSESPPVGEEISPPVPGDPSVAPLPLPAEAPSGALPAEQQSAQIGSIGPVGSAQEVDQLSRMTGGPANAATVLMLGPVVRGTTVNIATDTGDSQ